MGQQFPEFDLVDQNGKRFALKNLLGRWSVVYFYPKDNASACSLEAKDFTCLAVKFKELKAKAVGVSPDSIQSHAGFVEKKELRLILLSDPEKVLLKAVGAWGLKNVYGKESYGVVRGAFILDPKGAIQKAWTKVKVKGHAEAVLAKLTELKKIG
ncbi:MAG: peroxiredoxin [Deltaproteobacteria bacterium]|nr:peroxiredoxin [Deltaproteobacteria bacterium]